MSSSLDENKNYATTKSKNSATNIIQMHHYVWMEGGPFQNNKGQKNHSRTTKDKERTHFTGQEAINIQVLQI